MSDSDQKLRELIDERHGRVVARDYFGVLGLTPKADAATIQKEYFALAKQIHPDKIGRTGLDADSKARASELFKFVSDAYTVLMDPAKRQAAVQAAESGKSQAGPANRGAGKAHIEEAKIFQHKAQRLLQMRGYAQAEHFLRQAIKLSPDDAGIMTDLGWAVFNNDALAEKARMDEALALWTRARSLDKDDARPHYYMAQFYKAMGDSTKARSALEAALAVKPNYVEAQRELRLLTMREGKGGPARPTGTKSQSFLEKNLPFLAKLLKGGAKKR
ncbi:MAG: hypothetical protein AMXMBFR64_35560 [Myxococcales bacterium]